MFIEGDDRMGKNNIKVSVLVTFYNQKQYVDEALRSVFSQQTTFPFEVLLGDDGSSDGTYEKLLKWQSYYEDCCRVFHMDRDSSKKYEPIVRVSRNRLNLLKHASGKYIIFLDGDDYYLSEEKLQKQVDILEHHPECVACGHPVEMVFNKKSVGQLGNLDKVNKKIFKAQTYWSFFYLHADSLLFRNVLSSEWLENVCKDDFDDNLITYCYLKYGKIYYFSEVMVAYRQVPGSSWLKRNESEKVLANLKDYVMEKKIYHCFLEKESYFRHSAEIRWILKNRNKVYNDNRWRWLEQDTFLKKILRYRSHFQFSILMVYIGYYYCMILKHIRRFIILKL